jgi:hypothetical protein
MYVIIRLDDHLQDACFYLETSILFKRFHSKNKKEKRVEKDLPNLYACKSSV